MAIKRREFHALKTVLGGCYGSSPVLAIEDGAKPANIDNSHYVPSSRPGCLTPHVRCEDVDQTSVIIAGEAPGWTDGIRRCVGSDPATTALHHGIYQ